MINKRNEFVGERTATEVSGRGGVLFDRVQGVRSGRDEGVESLRVILMFGICLLHSVSMCGHPNRWIMMPLLACVDAFVFISGYYGIKFKISKLVRLYTLGLVCCAIAVTVPAMLGMGELPSLKECWLTYIQRSWFLHAYAVMMLLAPLVDIKKGFSTMWTVLVLVFVWAGLYSVPHLGRIFPRSAGVTAYSGLTLFGVYVAARLFRKYSLEKWFDKRKAIIASVVLYLLAARGWAEYSTPVALGLAALIFICGRKIKLGVIGRYIAPSTFAIYLLHSNKHSFMLMRTMEDALLELGVPIMAAYLAVGLTTFIACVIIDTPRRLVMMIMKKKIDAMMAKLDQVCENAVAGIEARLNDFAAKVAENGGGGMIFEEIYYKYYLMA